MTASLHRLGLNNIKSGKISSLPASISKTRTIFEKSLKRPKFSDGPTSSRPGPMLLIVAATAVKFVVKSLPSNEMQSTDVKKTRKNVMK